MSEIKHTAEPWEISESGMRGQYREINAKAEKYAYMVATTYGLDCKEDARRIVACVNACAGSSTEWLIGYGYTLNSVDCAKSFQHNIRDLAAQRDQLLEALKDVLHIECPLIGNPSVRELIDHWQYEKSEGNGSADVYLYALNAIAAVEQSK